MSMCPLEYEDLAPFSNRDDDRKFHLERKKDVLLKFISNKNSQALYTLANTEIMIRFFPE